MTQSFHARLAAGLLVALAALPLRAEETRLVPHVAEYKIKISLLGGTLQTHVFDVGEGYLARSIITPTGFASVLINGSIVEQSEFVYSTEGIRPKRYESIDTLSKEHKTMKFVFDWNDGAVSGDINEQDFHFDFDGAVHDRVSIQYELMHNLVSGDDARRYSLLDGDELKELTITNIGKRRVSVPYGEFDAVGIQHQADNSSRVSTLWCVPELGYLPVIIEQHRKGKLRVRAVLTRYAEITEVETASAATTQ